MNDGDILVGGAWARAIIQLEMSINGACIPRNVVSGFDYQKEPCYSSSLNSQRLKTDESLEDMLRWLLFDLSVGPLVCR